MPRTRHTDRHDAGRSFVQRLARGASAAAAAGVALLGTTAVHAADPALLPKEAEVKKARDDKQPEGWSPFLQLSANLAVAGSSNAIGQPDGHAVTVGLNILGRLDYLMGKWDWRNTLKLNEAFTRTPVVDAFVKSGDQLSLESVLYWNLTDWAGPFASFKLDTSVFPGVDVRASAVDYSVGGTIVANDTTHHRLAGAFEPLALKQALGAYLRPISTKPIEVRVKAGFGAAETFADDVEVLTDDAATAGVVELGVLKDSIQAGVVVGVEAKGEFDKGRLTYAAHAEVMLPFVNDDPADRDAAELANVDIGAKLGVKLVEWASLDYEVKLVRQPQLLDEWQFQHGLLLTFSYTAID